MYSVTHKSKYAKIVTGISSGFGRYIANNLDEKDVYFKGLRRNSNIEGLSCKELVHCAFDRQNLDLNVSMLEQLIEHITYQRFVFISSIDVYAEEKTDYAKMKLVLEEIVKQKCVNYLIVRCPTLCHKFMRPNSIIKVLQNKDVTVSADSQFNLVTPEDVLYNISNYFAYMRDGEVSNGEFNILAKDSISLGEVNPEYTGQYGSFKYDCGDITKFGFSVYTSTSSFVVNKLKTWLNYGLIYSV